MKELALYICSECQTGTLLPADSEHIVDEPGEGVQPLGFCGLVRHTHAGDHEQCIGDVAFAGYLRLYQYANTPRKSPAPAPVTGRPEETT